MSARVTDSEVKRILPSTVTADTTTFITAANILVDKFLGDQSLGDDLLKEMERWWSAHLYSISDPLAEEEQTGKASARYQGKTGMGLNATTYGQQVLTMDPTGILANIGKGPARFDVIQSPTEATPTTG